MSQILCIHYTSCGMNANHHLQVTMPDNIVPPTWSHSTMAHILCPGLIEVIKFGGCTDDSRPRRPAKDYTQVAETTIITFSELLYTSFYNM